MARRHAGKLPNMPRAEPAFARTAQGRATAGRPPARTRRQAVCTFAIPTGFSEKAFREPTAHASGQAAQAAKPNSGRATSAGLLHRHAREGARTLTLYARTLFG
jgi:hypothetical protein